MPSAAGQLPPSPHEQLQKFVDRTRQWIKYALEGMQDEHIPRQQKFNLLFPTTANFLKEIDGEFGKYLDPLLPQSKSPVGQVMLQLRLEIQALNDAAQWMRYEP